MEELIKKLNVTPYLKTTISKLMEGEYDSKFIYRKNKLSRDKDLIKKSGINKKHIKNTFDNYNYALDIQCIELYRNAIGYAKRFEDIEDSKSNSILLSGQEGSGKTHLSISIANALIDNDVEIIFMPFKESIDMIKENKEDKLKYLKLMNKFKCSRLLIVDDLFKGTTDKMELNIISDIIAYRYFNNMPMVISTQRTIKELISIDEVIAKRIINMCSDYCVEVVGEQLNYYIYGK